MEVFEHIDEIEQAAPTVITIGNFDGLHLGHMRIIQDVLSTADRYEAASAVMSFDPHPSAFFNPAKAPAMLTTPLTKQRLLAEAGIEMLIIQPFDEEFAALDPEKFVEEILLEKIGAVAVIVGANFLFGRDQSGDLGLLAEMGLRLGFEAQGIEAETAQGKPISSTWIRDCLQMGDLELANQLLGRNYELEGLVVKGSGRGTDLGFPTANMDGIQTMIPADGIYAAMAVVRGESYPSAVYIGSRPTFKDQRAVEVHLIDRKKELYDEKIAIHFHTRIREDKKFDDPKSLTAQIAADVAAARHLLSSGNSADTNG